MPIALTCEIKGCGKTFDEFGAIILSDPIGTLVVKKHVCKTCYEKHIVPLLDGVTQVNMSEEPKHKIEILKRCKELIEISHHAAAVTLYSTKHHVSFEEAHSVMKDLREGKISIE